MPNFKDWLVTIPIDDEYAPINIPSSDDLLYWIGQIERGDGTGFLHAQCYIELSRSVGLRHMRKTYGGRNHYEGRQGTRDEARTYCSKTPTRVRGPYEFGLWREATQGVSEGLQSAIAMLRRGESLDTIASQTPETYVRFRNGLEALQRRLGGSRRDKPVIYWYWGQTGGGKSHAAFQSAPEHPYVKDNTKWWSGYEGQIAIIWDEFDGTFDFRSLLRLLDKWEMQVETKGGYTAIRASKIIFTSICHPATYYRDEHHEFQRRMMTATITECSKIGASFEKEATIGNTELWSRNRERCFSLWGANGYNNHP